MIRSEELEKQMRNLEQAADEWRRIKEQLIRLLMCIADGNNGQLHLKAEQLAIALQKTDLQNDMEMLIQYMKEMLEAFQETDSIAPDVFSSGGSGFAGSGSGVSISESFSMTESYSQSKSSGKSGAGFAGASSKAACVSAQRDEHPPESRTETEPVFGQLPGSEDDDDIFAGSVCSSNAAPVRPQEECFAVGNAGARSGADTEPSPWHCRICGKQNSPDTLYCRTCGSSVHTARTVLPPKPHPEEMRPLLAARRSVFSSIFGRHSSKKQREKRNYNVSSTPPADETCRVDQVYFSALTDALVEPGDYYTLRLFMGMEEHRQVIEKIKQAAEKQLREDKTDIAVDVRKNQQVKVRITSAVAQIEENEMTLPWTGDVREFSFLYYVPGDVAGKSVPMTAQIYVDHVIATRLQILVPLRQKDAPVSFIRQDIKEAFMSYSSKDREQVLTFAQGLSRSRPDLKIFLDVKSLRSGQDWQEKLSRKIDACQVLYLCWSRAAKESVVVDYEWRHAFNTKGVEFIEPVPLEPPQLCAPPKELNSLHFNDLYMLLRLAERKAQELLQESLKE